MLFRKRVIGFILATDMASHASHLGSLNSIINANQIKNGENVDKLINGIEQN